MSERDEWEETRSGRSRADRVRAAGFAGGRTARGAYRVGAGAVRSTLRAARRASNAQGAGESGLGRLIEVHALSNAGDAAVTVGLAGTLFISAQPGEAKGHVALFLVLTMLPFAIVAPLIGPLLDRYRHGRRWAMGTTLALRGFLCWVLADAIERGSTWQFPAALAILVSSKAYLVTRSAAAPRLLPPGMTLVKANSRMSLAGVAGATIGGPLAGGAAAVFGATWSFRVAFALFVIGTILAITLPSDIDSERTQSLRAREQVRLPSIIVSALRANVGLRWISGFLTMFMAFLMKDQPLPGWQGRAGLLLGIVVGSAALGNALGTVAGSLVRNFEPRVVVVACLVADALAMVVCAVHFTLATAVIVGLVAGLGQQLGKLAVDSLIQDHLAEAVRTSAFARSETLLQLAWVVGGIYACLVPTDATIGLYSAAAILIGWGVLVMLWNAGRGPTWRDRRGRRSSPERSDAPASARADDEDGRESERWSEQARPLTDRPSAARPTTERWSQGHSGDSPGSSSPTYRPQWEGDEGWGRRG